MMCRRCAGHFDRSELGTVRESHPYGDGITEETVQAVCPECGSDEVYEEYACCECGEERAPMELEDGLCRLCVEELLQTLDWSWTMLSDAQKRWAAQHTAWMEH